jgi:hypothetical protein
LLPTGQLNKRRSVKSISIFDDMKIALSLTYKRFRKTLMNQSQDLHQLETFIHQAILVDTLSQVRNTTNRILSTNASSHLTLDALPLLDHSDPLYAGNIQAIGGPFRGADDAMANLERSQPLSISRRLVRQLFCCLLGICV